MLISVFYLKITKAFKATFVVVVGLVWFDFFVLVWFFF